jgi:ferritin-like metal-binding protein YciE
VDPRTTLLQSLEAILIAELADNACWEALIALAQQAGEDTLVQPFEQALVTEQEHLMKVRTWLAAGQGRTLNEKNGRRKTRESG